jgi:hypothetical protein
MPTSPSYVWWRGGKFNKASIASLLAAEKLAKLPVRVVQGGYNRGIVSASAGTHDGGGVVDMSVSGWSQSQINRMLLALRRAGWAAWHRRPSQGFTHHIHAVRNGDSTASWGAKAQVTAYRNGRNGLAGNGRDDGPGAVYTTWSKSPYNPANKPKAVRRAKPYVIQGKDYAPWDGPLYATSVNKARAASRAGKPYVSRPVHRLQLWLRNPKSGGYYKGPADGLFGPQTQAALDNFRRHKLGWSKKTDYQGPIGINSLTRLRDTVKSGYKVGA